VDYLLSRLARVDKRAHLEAAVAPSGAGAS
jgi:hypothetical protein